MPRTMIDTNRPILEPFCNKTPVGSYDENEILGYEAFAF